MRIARLLPPLLLFFSSCRSGNTEIEAGAILLEIKCAEPGLVPDELRVWAYDDTGRLWDAARIPAEGSLSPKSAQDMGSILIQPGALIGNLRVHVQGFTLGVRILDGTLIVTPTQAERTFDLILGSAIPADGDSDGVPDVIDNCPSTANPQQGGCPSEGDASVASSPDVPPVADDGAADTPPVPDGADGPNDPLPLDDGPASNDAPTVLSDARRDLPSDLRPIADLLEPQFEVLRVRDAGPDTLDAAGIAPADAADVGAPDAVVPPDLGRDGGPDLPVPPDADGTCGDLGRCNLPLGELCGVHAECASGVCADGVCCNNACLGPCRSCNQPDTMGTCQAYAVGTDPESECTSGATCNSAGACGAPPPPDLANGQLCSSGDQCASGYCVDGVCCNSRCDQPCFACGTGNCLTVRRTDDSPQCSGGHTCDRRGNCVPAASELLIDISDRAPEISDRLLH